MKDLYLKIALARPNVDIPFTTQNHHVCTRLDHILKFAIYPLVRKLETF